MTSNADKVRQRQVQKQIDRLKKEMANAKTPLGETGVFEDFIAGNPYGSRFKVRPQYGGGYVLGEFITPKAVTSSQYVAIYRSKTTPNCLFDC